LAWSALQPGLLPAAAALACAALLTWALWRGAQQQQLQLRSRVDTLDQRCREQQAALQRSESARAAAESELRAAETRYLLALRGSQDGLWEWDLDSGAVHLSPRWKSMLGFESQEIADDRDGWLARVHADDRPRLEQALRQHLDGGETRFDLELRLLHKDGSVRDVLSRGVAIRRESGAPYRMVGLDTDVTRLKRVQTVLDAVAEGTTGAFGQDFYPAMVRHFARALDVDRAFLTQCADEPVTRVRTLAFWSAKEGLGENIEFALAGTPCETVIHDARSSFHREGVARLFPREQGFESYLGLPIVASDGRVLGHLAFFDTVPRGDEMLVESVYRIFLARAAAEMEREQALARLASTQGVPTSTAPCTSTPGVGTFVAHASDDSTGQSRRPAG
jgi:PAS domain S-box-containing protein